MSQGDAGPNQTVTDVAEMDSEMSAEGGSKLAARDRLYSAGEESASAVVTSG